jgi:hypothetical protein
LFVLAARDSVRAPTLIVGVDWNNMRDSGAFQSAIPSVCDCHLIDSKVCKRDLLFSIVGAHICRRPGITNAAILPFSVEFTPVAAN